MQQIHIQPAAPGEPVVVTHVPAGVPATNAEYRALMAKREALSDQLVSASGRRQDLAAELRTADPSARAGIQNRLKVLDDRIVRLETEIDRTGDQVANAPPHVMTGMTMNPSGFANRIGDELVPITAILSVFVLFPLTLVMARYVWKRTGAPATPALAEHATQQRLEQIQQAIDTIAIEVERISEGQRFVTKMMAERDRSALGAGGAEPLRLSLTSAASSERG